MAIFIVLFVLLVGPAALIWGADSRGDDRGWFGDRQTGR